MAQAFTSKELENLCCTSGFDGCVYAGGISVGVGTDDIGRIRWIDIVVIIAEADPFAANEIFMFCHFFPQNLSDCYEMIRDFCKGGFLRLIQFKKGWYHMLPLTVT